MIPWDAHDRSQCPHLGEADISSKGADSRFDPLLTLAGLKFRSAASLT